MRRLGNKQEPLHLAMIGGAPAITRTLRKPQRCNNSLTKLSCPRSPLARLRQERRPGAFVGGADLEDQNLADPRGQRP